jgi:hypothetical protein
LVLSSERQEHIDMVNGLPEWISVDDKLPVSISSFLVWSSPKIYFAFFNSQQEWCWENKKLTGVTHWMPLPSPPDTP